jgi:hypothetical protein
MMVRDKHWIYILLFVFSFLFVFLFLFAGRTRSILLEDILDSCYVHEERSIFILCLRGERLDGWMILSS